MTHSEAIRSAAAIAVETSSDPGNDFPTRIEAPTSVNGCQTCEVFENSVLVARTWILDADVEYCDTVAEAGEWTVVEWLT